MILEQYYGSVTVLLFSGQNEQMALLLLMIKIIIIITIIDFIITLFKIRIILIN